MADAIDTYAVIQSGIVVNIALVNPGDNLDPSFDWVIITNLDPKPQIGWIYADTTFSPPGLPNDVYGNSVIKTSDDSKDYYSVGEGIVYNFTKNTPLPAVYLSLAIHGNILKFQQQAKDFIDSQYDLYTRMNFIGLYINASQNNLTNRIAYIEPLFAWQNAVITYCASYVSAVMVLIDPAIVLSTVPDFSSLVSSNPKLSPIAAIQISD